MTTHTTLKPCPWCGPKHEVEVEHGRDGQWHVTCTWCEVDSPSEWFRPLDAMAQYGASPKGRSRLQRPPKPKDLLRYAWLEQPALLLRCRPLLPTPEIPTRSLQRTFDLYSSKVN